MPLSLNEIRERARAFAKEWAGETSERAEAQSFWNDFFHVFGKKRRSLAVYEQKARRFTGKASGRIDLFWPGVMLAEHKSAGVDLDAAFDQATDYFAGLSEPEKPQYILVSDFQRFRLYDLDGNEPHVEFPLADLHHEIGRFGFISGYRTRIYKDEDPVNVQAAERMGRLHDALKATGYEGHALEVLLVRLLFCLFADDTGIFPRHAFHDLIDQRTGEDGGDLGGWLARLFQVLNTPESRRQTTLDEQLAELPYVNGKLFEEMLPLADFDTQMRALLLDASSLDWSRISPAIFGSMFQSVMNAKARRNLGAHYTSEKNILKLIGPLFLDGLKAELVKAGQDERKLAQLHRKLATLKFLDPACGCGNFLIIAYRELRALELEILKRQFARQQSVLAHVRDHVLVDVDQFHGIEIEEFPAQIAQVAMWLMDHQMNLQVAEQFGENVLRLPLKKSAAIVHGNALQIDWNEVVPVAELDYILGNPPFVGKKEQSPEQKAELLRIFYKVKGSGVLDYVACWYLLAAQYMVGTSIECAFVSTNSITQGEQVGILWADLRRRGIHINFAHRTFKWSNEARGKAAVFCVIVGFSLIDREEKQLFDYETVDGEPQASPVKKLNAYLVEAEEVTLTNRKSPISPVPEMKEGSALIDDGHLILSEQEARDLASTDPIALKWVRPLAAGSDYINGHKRYCLWLNDANPSELKSAPNVLKRVQMVRAFREKSERAATKKLAETPSLFGEVRQPGTRFVMLPKTSSERRKFVPMGYLEPNNVVNNTSLYVEHADTYHLGILISTMHMAWLRNVGGRLKSDYRYSAGIVYNNFPWPEIGDEKFRTGIESTAQEVLDARARFPDSTLADLYDPLTMPPALVKAHQQLDKAVDAAYLAAEKAAGRKPPRLGSDAERVAFLFQRYQALASLLPVAKPKRQARAKA